jgi:hypothetical protein
MSAAVRQNRIDVSSPTRKRRLGFKVLSGLILIVLLCAAVTIPLVVTIKSFENGTQSPSTNTSKNYYYSFL